MASHTAGSPYTRAELKLLYPANLDLQSVQILLRHGERSPRNARLPGTGLPAFGPYCSTVNQLRSLVLDPTTNGYTVMEWKRQLDGLGQLDEPILLRGPEGDSDGLCIAGMLTDRGHITTYDLGKRPRTLFIERLGFLPRTLHNNDGLYLRAIPVPRALESLLEGFSGLYPPKLRSLDMQRPKILVWAPEDETLFPTPKSCPRFGHSRKELLNDGITLRKWNT